MPGQSAVGSTAGEPSSSIESRVVIRVPLTAVKVISVA
jgi:hypothetical protein